jgi:hypothetical protein
MVAQVFLAKGAVVPEHKHESEQITYILEGALLFEIDGKEIVVGKGQVLQIPSWKPHSEPFRARGYLRGQCWRTTFQKLRRYQSRAYVTLLRRTPRWIWLSRTIRGWARSTS